jgi:hypothetical protein
MPGNRNGPATQPDLGDAVRSAAAQAGKLRAEALTDFLAGWQAEHGVLTAKQLAQAERELGLTDADAVT